jgi:UDP-2,3-diacylglucosamine hydrolase
MEPPVTVVGDVHLSEREPEVAERFRDFLASLEGRGGTLVLLGDLFDLWAGREQSREPFARGVLEAIARVAASGVRTAFVPGNRDFTFDGADGLALEVWPDLVRTSWGGRNVLLTHGDLLCTADRGYLRMRGLLRSGAGRVTISACPYAVRAWFARGLRRHSDRSGRHSPGARLGIDYGRATEWMEAHGADLLVAGHVHTGVHHRLPGPVPREVLVLRDWDHGGGGVVRFDGRRVRLERP